MTLYLDDPIAYAAFLAAKKEALRADVAQRAPKKIALIGSAPSSVTRGPYDDPTWEIWGVSPGAFPHCRRADCYFEIHSRTLDPAVFGPEYIHFLSRVPRVFTLEPWPELPNSQLLDFDAAIREWGSKWFSSSVSWMFAQAIKDGATEIGLWGIDMSAKEEYVGQKPACQRWIELCQEIGIRITLPIESDLNNAFPLYGLCEKEPFYVKMMNRKAELMLRYNHAKEQLHQCQQEMTFLEGAVDCINYDIQIWTTELIMQRYQTPRQFAGKGEQVPLAVDSPPAWQPIEAAQKPKPKGRNGKVVHDEPLHD